MKKSRYLWHGSVRKRKILKPSQALDRSGHKESNLKAVYATDLKRLAICFGLVDKSAVTFAAYESKPLQLVIIKGKIRLRKKFYLYKLNKKDFRKSKGILHQYSSQKEVIPAEIIELNVDDYTDYCRKATKKDKETYKSLIGRFQS